MMSLLDSLEPVMSEYGIPTPLSKGLDNLPVAQATLILLQVLRGEASLKSAIVFDNFLIKCKVGRGLYRRTPGNPDQNSVDNYTASAFIFHAKDIYWRCLWRFGNFANDKWELRSNFTRFFGFRPYAKFRAGFKLNWLDRQILKVCMKLTLNDDPTDTSNKCLQVLINYSLKDNYQDLNNAIHDWAVKMEAQYPDGLKGLYQYYWGKTHPFYLYAPSNWDFLK